MISRFTIKSDDFEIRAVGKRDQNVMAAHRMFAAGDDRETQLCEILCRLIEILYDNNQMIDAFEHVEIGLFKRGRDFV